MPDLLGSWRARLAALLLAAAALGGAVAAPSPASAAISPTGFNLENRGTHGYLDVAGASYTPGTRVIDWPWTGGANQRWIAVDRGKANGFSYFSLQAGHSYQCLDLEGGRAQLFVQLVQSSCNGTF